MKLKAVYKPVSMDEGKPKAKGQLLVIAQPSIIMYPLSITGKSRDLVVPKKRKTERPPKLRLGSLNHFPKEVSNSSVILKN